MRVLLAGNPACASESLPAQFRFVSVESALPDLYTHEQGE